MGTTLTAALLSGIRAVVARAGDFRAFRLHGSQFRRIIEDHTIGNLVATSVWLALVLAWNLDGRPDRSAGTGLQAGGRYLPC